eukprot:gene1008-600_t
MVAFLYMFKFVCAILACNCNWSVVWGVRCQPPPDGREERHRVQEQQELDGANEYVLDFSPPFVICYSCCVHSLFSSHAQITVVCVVLGQQSGVGWDMQARSLSRTLTAASARIGFFIVFVVVVVGNVLRHRHRHGRPAGYSLRVVLHAVAVSAFLLKGPTTAKFND